MKLQVFKKKSSSHSQSNEASNEIEIPKEWYIAPEKGKQIIDELRLV